MSSARSRAFAGLLAVTTALALPAGAGAKRNLYVSNQSTNDVSAFNVAADGSLSPVPGSPFATGSEGLALTPDGSHLYVADVTTKKLSAFNVAADGSLSAVGGFATGSSPSTVAVSPDGGHVYVTNEGSANLSAFNVAADGSLSPVPGSPFATGLNPYGIGLTPDGNHLYVADFSDASISAFNVAADGSLSAVTGSPFATGGGPFGLALTPDGAHLYVTNGNAANISAFNVAADGSLSALAGSPYATGTFPEGIAVTPDGGHLYAANFFSSTLSAFNVAADGSLSAVAGSPLAAGPSPFGLAVSPDASHLYATNAGPANVAAFNVAADGGLSAAPGSPFATESAQSNPLFVAITPDQGPRAAFSTRAAGPRRVRFKGSASSDPDGQVARYDWDFGDGQTSPNGGARPKHRYAKDGTYKVELTVTDNEKCSTTRIFTGQTVSCSGGPKARATKRVKVDSEVRGARLRARRTQKQQGKGIVVNAKAGAKEKVELVATGRVKAGKGSYALKKLARSAKARKTVGLRLKLRKSSDAKKVARALGGKVKARVSVRFTDAAGNTARRRKTVELR